MRRDHPLWQAIIDLKHGKNKTTRLSLAAKFGDLARVRELCATGADVGARDAVDDWTALHAASHMGREDCVRELIGRGADANAMTNGGYTPLMYACWSHHANTARLLLAAGADKRRVNRQGASAHDLALPGLQSSRRAQTIAALDAAP